MEEVPEDKAFSDVKSDSKKKYINIWRNKWITSDAGEIDDFIRIYENLADIMKRWKSEGRLFEYMELSCSPYRINRTFSRYYVRPSSVRPYYKYRENRVDS